MNTFFKGALAAAVFSAAAMVATTTSAKTLTFKAEITDISVSASSERVEAGVEAIYGLNSDTTFTAYLTLDTGLFENPSESESFSRGVIRRLVYRREHVSSLPFDSFVLDTSVGRRVALGADGDTAFSVGDYSSLASGRRETEDLADGARFWAKGDADDPQAPSVFLTSTGPLGEVSDIWDFGDEFTAEVLNAWTNQFQLTGRLPWNDSLEVYMLSGSKVTYSLVESVPLSDLPFEPDFGAVIPTPLPQSLGFLAFGLACFWRLRARRDAA